MLPEPIEGRGMSFLARGLAFLPSLVRNRHHHARGLLPQPVIFCSSATACASFTVDASIGDEASDIDEDVIDETILQSLIHGDNDLSDGNGQLPAGLIDGFFVVRQHQMPQTFNLSSPALNAIDGTRVSLSPTNVTLPIALMLIDSDEYPTLSRARKAIRQKSIVVHRTDANTNVQDEQRSFPRNSFARPQSYIGKASDRIVPGDIIGKQIRLSHGHYSRYIGLSKPPFDLPVLYEDDHIAVVNKPAGVAVYDGREKSHGRNTIRYALPHVLQPPRSTKNDVDGKKGESESESDSGPQPLSRPITCHRLDRPTSGLLVCAKTLESVVDMSRQFEHRIVRKTYAAIVNGKLEEREEDGDAKRNDVTTISSREAYEMGVDVDPNDSTTRWQVAHDMQEGKEALTIWRVLKQCPSTKAKDGILTLVELKPKTGRKHQLRRHLAWNYGCPIVGDTTYGDLHDAKRFGRGLMLTSCHIAFEHPYYSNSEAGTLVWKTISSLDEDGVRRLGNNVSQKTEDSPVIVDVSIDPPNKFMTLLLTEEKRALVE